MYSVHRQFTPMVFSYNKNAADVAISIMCHKMPQFQNGMQIPPEGLDLFGAEIIEFHKK